MERKKSEDHIFTDFLKNLDTLNAKRWIVLRLYLVPNYRRLNLARTTHTELHLTNNIFFSASKGQVWISCWGDGRRHRCRYKYI